MLVHSLVSPCNRGYAWDREETGPTNLVPSRRRLNKEITVTLLDTIINALITALLPLIIQFILSLFTGGTTTL